MLLEGDQADKLESTTLGFFPKSDVSSIPKKGQNIHRGRRSLRVHIS